MGKDKKDGWQPYPDGLSEWEIRANPQYGVQGRALSKSFSGIHPYESDVEFARSIAKDPNNEAEVANIVVTIVKNRYRIQTNPFDPFDNDP